MQDRGQIDKVGIPNVSSGGNVTVRLDRILARAREEAASERPSKITTLDRLIADHVEPGMTLHLGVTHVFPHALGAELIRSFGRTSPGFTLVAAGVAGVGVAMLHLGMVERVITSYAGDIYPAPAPNKVVQRVYADASVTFEHWSLLSLIQRLLAGAMGLPAMPTRSIAGSSMAEDNAAAYREIPDPFGGGGSLQLVGALQPDLTLLHAWAADEDGNCLLTPPYSEETFGAMAAHRGALVTVERLVDRDFVAAHSDLVRLPGRYVRGVAVAPFGGHPGGLFNRGLAECEPYAEDYDFVVDFRQACRSDADLDAWIGRWITEPGDHAGYLDRLGEARLRDLLRRGRADAWETDLRGLGEAIDFEAAPGQVEEMVAAAAGVLADRIDAGGYDTILAGQGYSNLAAWLAASRRPGVQLAAEVGMLGYSPRPASPFLFNFANLPTCTSLSSTLTALGIWVGGATARAIGSLGAGQVDRFGNVNSTAVPPVFHLVGSGGANDVAGTAGEVILTCPADPMRLVDRVPYRTFCGDRVRALVTTEGVMKKGAGEDELVLTAVFPRGRSLREAADTARKKCGWPLKVAAALRALPDVDGEELERLRSFDPRGSFLRG